MGSEALQCGAVSSNTKQPWASPVLAVEPITPVVDAITAVLW